MKELFWKVQNLIVNAKDMVGGEGKRRMIGSTAFISLFNTFRVCCCWFSLLDKEEPNTHTAIFGCPHQESPTFCLAVPQDANKHTVWGGSEAVIGQFNINEGQGEGELFSFIPSLWNNTTEQSREVRLHSEFYFNMVTMKDFTSATFKKFQNISSKEEKLMNS